MVRQLDRAVVRHRNASKHASHNVDLAVTVFLYGMRLHEGVQDHNVDRPSPDHSLEFRPGLARLARPILYARQLPAHGCRGREEEPPSDILWSDVVVLHCCAYPSAQLMLV